MKHYLLYGHGGSYNHGTEALARCTIALLRRMSPNCKITLSTHFAEQDREFALFANDFAERNLGGKTAEEIYASTIERIAPQTVCLHIGGDNYCYRNWERWATLHYKALERGAKSILWSCSIEPQAINAEMLEVLRTHHLITARESVTYNALVARSLTNVVTTSDIAFTLEPKPVEFRLENFVALNLSPLVIKKNPEVFPAFQALIDYILRETNLNIALVPHVVQPVDNDCDALRLLNCHDSGRAVLVSDKLSAGQYKYIIGKARLCVAARTHAAIAAYSSCVPVLAIGYSAKSQGIADDLAMSNYVISIEEISKLTEKFKLLAKNETKIRAALSAQMPQYVQKAVCDYIF
jgi:polysaccharide pyruvyl transferase WcaK-like protein